MIYPWNIIGHEKQLLALEREVLAGQLSHAMLFHGPKDTGKFSVALTLAKILLCPHNLCRQCQDCQLIQAGTHPDFILFRDQGESIKIDDVRELIYKTNLTSQGGLRIVLIENLERMPIEAQNSFLKTLEEPPGKTIFLMTTSRVKRILLTILSRVRQQPFFLVDDAVVRAALSSRFGHSADFEECIQIAQGRPGMAIKLLSQSTHFMQYREMYYHIERMLKENDVVSKFAYVEALDEREDEAAIELFFDVFAQILRKSAHDFVKMGKSTLSPRYNLKTVVQLFEKLLKTRYLVDRNANQKLALENFLLSTEQ